MADANSSTIKNSTDYSGLPQVIRVTNALGMIEEIINRDAKLYALCTSITDLLLPWPGEDSPDINALKLSEVMQDILGNISIHVQLKSCLMSMAADCKGIGHE